MKVICSWCGKLIRIKENKDSSDGTSIISHSICPDCSRKVKEETEKVVRHREETHKLEGTGGQILKLVRS